MLLGLQSFTHSLHMSTEGTRQESGDVGFPGYAKLAAAKQLFVRCRWVETGRGAD